MLGQRAAAGALLQISGVHNMRRLRVKMC